MDEQLVRDEIDALEHVSFFDKSVNTDYTLMTQLLKDRTGISFEVILELIESMSRDQTKSDSSEANLLLPMRSTFSTENETSLADSDDLQLHQKMGLDRISLSNRGLSVGKVREYLITMEGVHRAVWQPNLNIYGNDKEDVELKNTFQIVGSLKQQILCIYQNYKHTHSFEPASRDQNQALDQRLGRLMKQLDQLKSVIHQVKLLNQLNTE